MEPRASCALLGLLALASLASEALSGASADREYLNPLTKLAFGSCNDPRSENPVWQALSDTEPDAFAWLGDCVYADTLVNGVSTHAGFFNHERLFHAVRNDHQYQRVLNRTTAIIGTMDDHDYGVNDCGKRELSGIGESTRQLFLDFLGEPSLSFLRQRDGIYGSFDFGPPGRQAKIVVLDTRYNRDDLDSGGQMLGEHQWRWLNSTLTHSHADVHIVVSSILVLEAHLVRLFGLERKVEGWWRFPHEKQRLMHRLSTVSGVVLLTGDVHHGTLHSAPPGCELPYELNELTSSGMTHTILYENAHYESNATKLSSLPTWLRRVFLTDNDYFAAWPASPAPFIGFNFGTVKIDWEQRTIRLAVHDTTGEERIAKSLSIDRMLPNAAHKENHQSLCARPLSNLRLQYVARILARLLRLLFRSWTSAVVLQSTALLWLTLGITIRWRYNTLQTLRNLAVQCHCK
jgi:alkaline phosphatase D